MHIIIFTFTLPGKGRNFVCFEVVYKKVKKNEKVLPHSRWDFFL